MTRLLYSAVLLTAAIAAPAAQSDGFDEEAVVLAFHKVSGARRDSIVPTSSRRKRRGCRPASTGRARRASS